MKDIILLSVQNVVLYQETTYGMLHPSLMSTANVINRLNLTKFYKKINRICVSYIYTFMTGFNNIWNVTANVINRLNLTQFYNKINRICVSYIYTFMTGFNPRFFE